MKPLSNQDFMMILVNIFILCAVKLDIRCCGIIRICLWKQKPIFVVIVKSLPRCHTHDCFGRMCKSVRCEGLILTRYGPGPLDVPLEQLGGGGNVQLGARLLLAVVRDELVNPLSAGGSNLPENRKSWDSSCWWWWGSRWHGWHVAGVSPKIAISRYYEPLSLFWSWFWRLLSALS